MKNILMVDIETTGTKPGCKVLSIGAFGFDKDGNQVQFYKRISPSLQELIGLTDDVSTLEWWSKQPEEAKQEAFGGTESPKEVAASFFEFFWNNFSTLKGSFFSVWCCGLDFDFPILSEFLKKSGQPTPIPWPFWTQCDYRTIKNVFQEIKMHEGNVAKHNALEDAKAQMRGLRYFYENIKPRLSNDNERG